jgi:transposase-like protein
VDPTTAFCPNLACPARGQAGKGNISVHSHKERRFICKQCGKTFAENKGTAFYRLHTSAQTVTLVVTLLAHGCPVQAIVAAFGFDERTVADWLDRAGAQCQAVHEHLVEKPRRLGQVQADELRVKIQAQILWMAMALVVRSRLWLGGEVSQTRDLSLIRPADAALGGAAHWSGGSSSVQTGCVPTCGPREKPFGIPSQQAGPAASGCESGDGC